MWTRKVVTSSVKTTTLSLLFLLSAITCTNVHSAHTDIIELKPGLNLVGIPFDPSTTPDTFSLIQRLGTPAAIKQLQRFNQSSGVFDVTEYDVGGNPSGVNASLESNEGWLVFAETVSTLTITSHAPCPTVSLQPGLNVLGIPCTPLLSSAYEVIQAIGDSAIVASIQTFDLETGRFLTAGYNSAGVLVGPDFPIQQHKAYFVHIYQAISFDLFLPRPELLDFNPKVAPIGTLITITGNNLDAQGVTPQITLAAQDGGTLQAPVASSNPTQIQMTIPPGAATGPLTIDLGGQVETFVEPLTIITSTNFTLSAGPVSADVIQGESVVYAVTLDSTDGFSQLASLSVQGLPSGMSAQFVPPQIAAGQTSILSITASATQPLVASTFSIFADAEVDGIAVQASQSLDVNVIPVTTSFMGQMVIADTLQSPLESVTVTFLGLDGNGGETGCNETTVSDAAGNFVFTNLPPECLGKQLIRYDGLTVTNAPGDYAGVDLIYTIVADQVTISPVLVHLPRIDDKETVMIPQNSPVDLFFTFDSIPNLEIIVYANTIFTKVDGSQPDPFPLTAIEVPIDRLPEEMPPSPDTVMPFIVAFQPANAEASQPVAVTFPNRLSLPPFTVMPLSTLDPTKGVMVDYGTGTVSADGTKVVPDLNPSTPGKRYGLVHFDWHGQRPSRDDPNNNNPCVTCPCPITTNPIDIASGLEVIRETDITIAGGRGSISINRTYRNLSNSAGPFGIGSNHNYGYRLVSNTPLTDIVITLVSPDGNRFPFAAVGDGTFINSTVPSMRGAVITVLATGEVDLRWKTGTIFHFVPSTFVLGSLLETITETNGNVITLIRNAASPVQITEIVDPVGRRLQLSYDTTNRITSIVDPIGRTVGYTYAGGRLATVTDVEGGVTEYTYNTQNRLTEVMNARGVIVAQNVYDATGRVIEQTQADGGIITFDYTLMNPAIAISPVIKSIVTDPEGNVTTYRFSPEGILLDATDALGQVKTFEREIGTNLLLAIRGNGTCSVCGDPRSGDVSFSYDLNGNVLTRADSLGNATDFSYEPIYNKVSAITDPLSNSTSSSYDSFGNLISQTDQNTNETTFLYNAFGQITEQTDPLGKTTTFTYDDVGNLVGVTDALGNTTTHRYDAISRLIETIDALGRSTTIIYDNFSRVIESTDGRGNTTLTTYDEVGNRLSVTDARGNAISFTYDSMNRLGTRTDSLGNVETRSYDFNGNLVEYINRRGQISNFAYDVLNRLVSETYADGASVLRSYDSNSRLIQVNDSEGGAFSFSYDGAGRLLGSFGPSGSVDYTRDQLGRVLSRQVVGQTAVDYSYDPVGSLLSATMPQASASYSYDARNRMLTQTRANGVTTDYSYDVVGRMLSLTHSSSTGVLEAQTYGYDAIGNRITKLSTIAQPLQTTPSLNSFPLNSNQLQQRDAVAYTYDQNGNRLTETNAGVVTTYQWDSRNRLKSIQSPTEFTGFKYDFRGGLIAKNVGIPGPVISQTQKFVLDEQTNVVHQSDTSAESFSILTGQSIDQHLATITTSGQVEYGLRDAINSTVLSVDDAGTQVGSFQYEPFGQTSSIGSSYPFQFTGRVSVAGDIYHYRARYYDSLDGRFISEDPIGINGGDINFFRYVANNPISWADPTGLQLSGSQNVGCYLRELWNAILFFAPTRAGCMSAGFVACTIGCLGSVTLFPACWGGCITHVAFGCNLVLFGPTINEWLTNANRKCNQCPCS